MLLVEDAFEIFPADLRRFGFSKSIGVGLSYNYAEWHDSFDEETRYLNYRYYPNNSNLYDTLQDITSKSINYTSRNDERLSKYVIASLSYSKPINMKWQLLASAFGRFYFDSYEKNNSFSSREENNIYDTNTSNSPSRIKKQYNLSGLINTDYFYSSRTVWRTSLRYSFLRYQNDPDNDIRVRDYQSWSFNINTSLEYRLNIPTTIKGTVAYSNSENKDVRDDVLYMFTNTGFNFSFSILHYIY